MPHIHTLDCKKTPEALAAYLRIAIDWMAKQDDEDTDDYADATYTAEWYRDVMEAHYPEFYLRFLEEEKTRDYEVLV